MHFVFSGTSEECSKIAIATQPVYSVCRAQAQPYLCACNKFIPFMEANEQLEQGRIPILQHFKK